MKDRYPQKPNMMYGEREKPKKDKLREMEMELHMTLKEERLTEKERMNCLLTMERLERKIDQMSRPSRSSHDLNP